MIENFEVYYRKIKETHAKTWELAITALRSVPHSGMEHFLGEFEKKIISIYCSENWSRARIARRVHQILMSLEQLIVSQTQAMNSGGAGNTDSMLLTKNNKKKTRSRPKSPLEARDRDKFNNIMYSRRSSDLNEKNRPAHSREALVTNFKSLAKKLENQILRILDRQPMGSVELLYGRLNDNRHRLMRLDAATLIELLRQSCQNDYESLIDKLFPKKGSARNMSFVRQSTYRNNTMSRGSGFLEQHSMVSDSGSHKNSQLMVDSTSGVLHDDRHFFNPTQAILLHLLRAAKVFDAVFFGDFLGV